MKRMAFLVVVLVSAFGLIACQEMRETPAEGADRLIVWSADTLQNFARLPELKDFVTHIPTARAVMILPAIVKAGFFIGAEAGSGVLLAKAADGTWGYPAFYCCPRRPCGCRTSPPSTSWTWLSTRCAIRGIPSPREPPTA